MQVNGAIYALWFIPLSTASLNITNVTFQMDLSIPSSNGADWHIENALFLDVQDV